MVQNSYITSTVVGSSLGCWNYNRSIKEGVVMKVNRETNMLHPVLLGCVLRIQRQIIDPHSMPIRLFETGRTPERHQELITRGKTTDIMSNHLYDLDVYPPLYTTAVDYVYYDSRWSWNVRNSTVLHWYKLFGNMVSDICTELYWKGLDRNNANYNHFELTPEIILEHMDKYPCVFRP